jgi:hypothetical protein
VGLALTAAGLLLSAPMAAAAPVATQLTLAGPSKTVPTGSKAKLTATLISAGKAIKGKKVAFLSGATALGTATTDSKGRARRNVKLTAPITVVARYTPAGGDAAAYTPSESAPVSLTPGPKVSVSIRSFLRAGKRAVGITRSPVRVRGSVAPFAAGGGGIELSVFRGQRRVLHETRRVSASRDGRGKFSLWIKPTRRGVYRVMVKQPGAAVADSQRLYVVRSSARSGSRGLGVRALQRRLKDLGYVTPINGHYGGSTARAVLAFRKVNGFSRNTTAGRSVFRRLARGGGGFKLRYPKAGKHVEFDWSRQVLVLARGSRPQMIVHTSSGAPSTPTVMGKYRFYRRVPGYNAKRMYYSIFFVGGYAIHGFDPVPNYPASHGCLRIPIPTAKRVYGWVSLGDPIYTYR